MWCTSARQPAAPVIGDVVHVRAAARGAVTSDQEITVEVHTRIVTSDGRRVYPVSARGPQVVREPVPFRGTAFRTHGRRRGGAGGGRGGVARADVPDRLAQVHAATWEPVYPTIEAV